MNSVMQEVLEKRLLESDETLYGVYRLLRNEDRNSFRGLAELRRDDIEPHKEMYTLLYIHSWDTSKSLGDIYIELNAQHPNDYLCASLSTGDIVVLNRNGDISAHFVDRFRFVELPNFIKRTLNTTKSTLSACPLCGQPIQNGERYCRRCSALHMLFDTDISIENLVSAFWDHCFACEAEIVATVKLTPDSLIIQCDNCGEVHVIPFTAEDILQYIRSGIVREMVADE